MAREKTPTEEMIFDIAKMIWDIQRKNSELQKDISVLVRTIHSCFRIDTIFLETGEELQPKEQKTK